MMTTHEVQTLLTIGENIVIEFKRAGDGPKWDTYESICAFLNRNGGDVLLLGSDDCIGGSSGRRLFAREGALAEATDDTSGCPANSATRWVSREFRCAAADSSGRQ